MYIVPERWEQYCLESWCAVAVVVVVVVVSVRGWRREEEQTKEHWMYCYVLHPEGYPAISHTSVNTFSRVSSF